MSYEVIKQNTASYLSKKYNLDCQAIEKLIEAEIAEYELNFGELSEEDKVNKLDDIATFWEEANYSEKVEKYL